MAGKFTVLPDERFAALRPLFEARLKELAWMLGERFEDFFDLAMRGLLVDGFNRAGAHEGTVWLLDDPRQNLIPRFNSGPDAAKFVGSFRQSLRAGMISMVVATEQPICENDMAANQRQDKSLDQQLHVQTSAMLAVPFYFVGELRGVISCVKLKKEGANGPAFTEFPPESLRELQLTAAILSRLIEHRLLTVCLGLEALG